jgi:hypothetical protein
VSCCRWLLWLGWLLCCWLSQSSQPSQFPNPTQTHETPPCPPPHPRYDYLSPVPGPNGPLPWQLKNIKLLTQGTADGGSSSSSSSSKKKGKVVPAGSVFLGLNFYG